jgi:hypothetical protein
LSIPGHSAGFVPSATGFQQEYYSQSTTFDWTFLAK